MSFGQYRATCCSVLNKLTLYLKQKKVKKHGKVQ